MQGGHALAEQDATVKRDIEKAQWTMQALSAGIAQDPNATAGPDGAGEYHDFVPL